jgi:PAS domain S-box-containing protein
MVQGGRKSKGKPAESQTDGTAGKKSLQPNPAADGRLWQRYFMTMPSAGLVLTPDHVVVAANPATAEALGIAVEEMIGRKCYEFLHGMDRPASGCPLEAVKEGAHGQTVEAEMEMGGRTVVVSCTPITGESGRLEHIVHVATDVTGKRKIERWLRESDLRHRAIIDAFDGHIYICSQDYRIEFMNRRLIERAGYDGTGELCYKVIHGFDRPCEWCVKDRVFNGETVQWEVKSPRDNHWYHVTDAPLYHADGRISKQAMIVDITDKKEAEAERKELQSQLLHSLKMDAVGQLADGIAHEFNNILMSIMGYGTLMQRKMGKDDPFATYLSRILSSSERAARLIQSLLAFSRRRAVSPHQQDLAAVLRDAEKVIRPLLTENITVTTRYEGKLPCMADEAQIQQVMINLTTNARDAMPSGGTFAVAAYRAQIDAGFIEKHGFGREGAYAVIEVSDTGVGMDKGTKERIFEPFFTTKEPGKGAGLGLAIVYGIIKQHQGYIVVHTEPQSGTRFFIYLPLFEV